MRLLILTVLIVFAFSCGKKEKKPDYIFSHDRMVEVLTEFQISEAIVRLGYHRTKDSIIYNDTIYSSVFRKLNIDRSQYDSSFTYYSQSTSEEFEEDFRRGHHQPKHKGSKNSREKERNCLLDR